MGIKGIYREIGSGDRIALSKLAVEFYERNNRPLRIAIDISIWHFQIQSGRGGTNPALRTLYYRLLRLLALGIQPLFVFDGPNKPPFKRNMKTNPHSVSLPNYLSKQLLKLFGFPFHTAPGEAEADCALLQKEGVVDAVLSEDVDTIMFGSKMTLRNWSSEGPRGSKSPTHVNVHTANVTNEGPPALDSHGMVLVALMSGGDYIPAGVPRCGIKIACAAARAGFGQDLCRLSKEDRVGLRQWRERLQYELETNESKFFRNKQKALRIPESFPDMAVLGYYTQPVVSSAEKVARLSSEISWTANVDVAGLRSFVIEAFDWDRLSGAKKFVRGLAPPLLVHKLCLRSEVDITYHDDLEKREKDEKSLVASICGRRSHFATDATPELRVEYTPIQIVGLDLELEEKDSLAIDGLSDSEAEHAVSVDETQHQSENAVKRRARPTYDPALPEKLWVLESYVKLGVPLLVENWEEALSNAVKASPRKPRTRTTIPKPGSKQVSLDSFTKISKPSFRRAKIHGHSEMVESGRLITEDVQPAVPLPASVLPVEYSKPKEKAKAGDRHGKIDEKSTKSKATPRSTPENLSRESLLNSVDINPWTLSKRPSDTFNVKISSTSKYPALGIDGSASGDKSDNLCSKETGAEAEVISLVSPVSRSDSSPSPSTSISPTGKKTMSRDNKLPNVLDEIPPSPPELLSTPQLTMPLSEIEAYALALSIPSSPTAASKTFRKQILLRESLDGAWRTAEPWEAKEAHAKAIYDAVEEIDLTSSP
ncbi:hypothetical protein MMC07_000661 [Pseudocyphellaria aurata]|nr:hypothetical protein [Pseudocyphellaria aurata]